MYGVTMYGPSEAVSLGKPVVNDDWQAPGDCKSFSCVVNTALSHKVPYQMGS